MSFMVVTTDGTRVDAGRTEGMGLSKDEADASAKDRNRRAEELGIACRYKVTAYTEPEKD
jgi:hypothetical protein